MRDSKLYSTDFKDFEDNEYHRIAKKVKNFSGYAYVTKKGDLFVYSFFLSQFKKKSSGEKEKPFLYEKIMQNISECETAQGSMTDDGKLYGMAADSYFARNLGIKIEDNNFSKINFISDDVKSFMVTGDWSGFVKKDGSLWMCGQNSMKEIKKRGL